MASLRQRKLLVGSLAHKLNVIHRIEMKSLTMIQAARELGVTASAVSQMMDLAKEQLEYRFSRTSSTPTLKLKRDRL